MTKKILSFILVICLGLCFVGCGNKGGNTDEQPPAPTPTALGTPTNLTAVLSGTNGIVSWAAVDNATSYIVTLNGEEKTTPNTYYQIINVAVDYDISVVAHADGYLDSEAATTTLSKPEITVGISGRSEVRSEGESNTITLVANVEGTSNKAVTWSITDGEEYASIEKDSNGNGKLTAKKVTDDKLVTVKATSVEDQSVSAIKRITITAKPNLTQTMLDALDGDKLGFEGYLIVNLYSLATGRFHSSISYDIKTAMDGTNWYAQYQMSSGVASNLYYQNHEGIASLVTVSFMNDESFTPMLDDDNNPIAWEDSGLQNNFKALNEGDFNPPDESTWRLTYHGSDETLPQRVVASACPYDFEAKNFSLIVEDGEVAGIYAESEDDYSVAEQYVARMELTVALNTGDAVKVPTLRKYEYKEDFHAELKTALENMRALDSYSMDFLNTGANVMTSTYDSEGFEETITADVCHFKPYLFTPDSGTVGSGNGVKDYSGEDYGYIDRSTVDKNLYNSYYSTDDGKFAPTRAYEKEFSTAKPTFAFAAELFTQRYVDETDGSVTYYVDEPMSAVASMFYYGVGNDIALYGLFAQRGYTQTTTFTPYVVVKDGYIVESGFYYYLGYLYGVVEISYSKFNATTTDTTVEEKLGEMETRQVPTSWNDVTITISSDNDDEKDKEQNALEYLKSFYKDDAIADKLPFFGKALGDTYGFGLTTYKTYNHRMYESVVFYYDVPLDVDYTIETSLAAVRALLIEEGFTKGDDGVFTKGEIKVEPIDSSLDLNINIWRDVTTPTPAA